jgi:hypothetical protein
VEFVSWKDAVAFVARSLSGSGWRGIRTNCGYRLHGMHGNVCEWCQDRWSDNLPGGIAVDRQGPATSSPLTRSRVVRGGYWNKQLSNWQRPNQVSDKTLPRCHSPVAVAEAVQRCRSPVRRG